MKEQGFIELPIIPNLEAIAQQNNISLEHIFRGKIKGSFLIDIKRQVMEVLGVKNLIKYYDLRWSDARMITGMGEAVEYDICRMIVGIHRAYSVFLLDNEIQRNEKSKRYKQQLISEVVEKIKIRLYGSVHFRKMALFQGEEFLYYPLPYELFAMIIKMREILVDGQIINCGQLYYGVIQNGISALSLLADNLSGTAYPLCRGAIEMYFKLLVLTANTEIYDWYERFREFEVEQSCKQTYPEEFNLLFEKRIFRNTTSKAAYLHFGWVDFISEYHSIVQKSPYSIYGIVTFLKNKNEDEFLGLECLKEFYKACHAYTHGSIQIAKYPVLHYFEISIILYYIIRETFLLLCKEKKVEATIDGNDIISMIDRDFKILFDQYQIRSTERFEKCLIF